ncbi:MAG: hypothetical protein AAF526_09775 [Pseudomonadota bacterium]
MIWLEALSYIVTILGLPTAVYVIWQEERRRRAHQEAELHRNLSAEYDAFLRLILENSDLLLFWPDGPQPELTREQVERRDVVFRMLISLFEKAFIILYLEEMGADAARRWRSWEDDMREWCRREDFRAVLPEFLEGEDDEFSLYILALAREEAPGDAA